MKVSDESPRSKALTSKDMKETLWQFKPSCSFVSLVVDVFGTLPESDKLAVPLPKVVTYSAKAQLPVDLFQQSDF
jgi:hypothetical protein